MLRPRLSAAGHELLAKARARAAEDLQSLGETVEAIEAFARASEDLSSRLHHEVLASRMRPLADGIRGFPRLVRDMARELGKQARFEVDGEATGVDRDILDRLEAPLNHLIRNALDHGVESPEDRRAAGKPPVATIRLEARHRAGMLQIVLSDDGRGVDLERLRAKVVERGLTTAAMARQLGEAELLDFLFLPGFITKEQVTEVSGRGVGLDVVQSMVHSARGSVRVASRPGKGTRFILQLPITFSVIRALLVEIAGEPYAFPLSRIDRILMVDREDVRDLEGKPHVLLDDQLVGLVDATRVLELDDEDRRTATADSLPVVVASDRSHRFGVVVDRFLGERDLRVSPLDARLGKVPNINSSSVLEDGWPVLIVNVEDLVRSVDNLLSGRRLGKLAAEVAAEHRARTVKRILVVDDSITVRELERQLLESRGYTVDVAVDGVDGWNAVRSTHYDLVVSDIDMPRMDGIAAGPPHQGRRPAPIDPGRRRLVQGPRGGPDQGTRRRRQLLSDQEQLPRPDVLEHRRRPDRRGAGIVLGRCGVLATITLASLSSTGVCESTLDAARPGWPLSESHEEPYPARRGLESHGAPASASGPRRRTSLPGIPRYF